MLRSEGGRWSRPELTENLGHQARSSRPDTSSQPTTRSFAQRTSKGMGQGTTRSSRPGGRARQERGDDAERAGGDHGRQLEWRSED